MKDWRTHTKERSKERGDAKQKETMMSIDRGEPLIFSECREHTHAHTSTERTTQYKIAKKAQKHAYTYINMHVNVSQPTPSEKQTHNNSNVLFTVVEPQNSSPYSLKTQLCPTFKYGLV